MTESASISLPTTVTRAVILAAGTGSKMWPYGVTQAKAALPVGAKPLLCHTLQVLHAVGVQEVGIVCGHLEHQLRHAASLVREGPAISWIRQPVPEGTAAALETALEAQPAGGDTLVLFGDVLVFQEDIARLMQHHAQRGAPVSVLVTPLGSDSPQDWVSVRVENGAVRRVWAHPRGGAEHRLAGAFVVSDAIKPYLQATGEYGAPVQVGVMPAGERDLSTTLAVMLRAGIEIAAVESALPTVDLDKPWQLLEANGVYVREVAGKMSASSLAEGAYVDPAAKIQGNVRLGKGARIEGPCIIKGNVIVGDGSVIRDGAKIGPYSLIGPGVIVQGDVPEGTRVMLQQQLVTSEWGPERYGW